MPRFCIVAPTNILQGLKRDSLMGSYHLLLAHDVVKHAKAYEELFSYRTGNIGYSNRYVVLDNSIIELGTAVDLKMMKEAAAIVHPTCLVLPDVMYDSVGTISSCKAAIDEWTKELDPIKNGYKYMFVPQGISLTGFAACAEAFADEPMIDYWGIPRLAVKHLGTRRDLIQLCNVINRRRLIHMLGFSDNQIDDALCAASPLVYAIDSAVPLRTQTEWNLTCDPGPRGDWWDNAQYTPFVKENLEYARRIFSYRG